MVQAISFCSNELCLIVKKVKNSKKKKKKKRFQSMASERPTLVINASSQTIETKSYRAYVNVGPGWYTMVGVYTRVAKKKIQKENKKNAGIHSFKVFQCMRFSVVKKNRKKKEKKESKAESMGVWV
ncbi:hypothetical protein CLIB1423_14S01926 [[Candida] railenensis]|uniref:Uncharacterized protein n=1 Tax=[Candida] railenensis TaxID=45579 RepID=A0A9P0QSD2_9ASCO|nr:hypothetical protein CLIB1423_14S01926 [[Candida] railenensis]